MKIQNKRVLGDSNVWIYSSNTLSDKYKKACEFRNLVVKDYFKAHISHQIINETLRVLTHHNFDSNFTSVVAQNQVKAFIKISNVISPTPQTLSIFLDLIKSHKVKSNNIYDAYLVATALTHDIEIIATDNVKSFAIYKEIKVFNPFV